MRLISWTLQSGSEQEGLLYRLEYNFLERLWAYLTLQNLFVKLARGELVSCQQPSHHHPQVPLISYSCVVQESM
jgi:hypothetical protein